MTEYDMYVACWMNAILSIPDYAMTFNRFEHCIRVMLKHDSTLSIDDRHMLNHIAYTKFIRSATALRIRNDIKHNTNSID
jgi:hypothetical protein